MFSLLRGNACLLKFLFQNFVADILGRVEMAICDAGGAAPSISRGNRTLSSSSRASLLSQQNAEENDGRANQFVEVIEIYDDEDGVSAVNSVIKAKKGGRKPKDAGGSKKAPSENIDFGGMVSSPAKRGSGVATSAAQSETNLETGAAEIKQRGPAVASRKQSVVSLSDLPPAAIASIALSVARKVAEAIRK